jgi:hypothetical protein
MTGQSVNQTVEELVRPGALAVERFERVLGIDLKPSGDNPHWSMYTGELPGAFAQVEVRLNKSAPKALVVLTPRAEPAITQAELDLAPWGEVQAIDPNPRIPPEGTDALIFHKDGVQVAFQFTHRSRRLRLVALEYGKLGAPQGAPGAQAQA